MHDKMVKLIQIPTEPEIARLIYQDHSILIVNKPPGLLTIADGYNSTLPYLSSILMPQFGRIWVVHRLDRDTSGVIIFARSKTAHKHLNLQFAKRQIRKTYQALIIGNPEWEDYWIQLPLRVNGDRKHRTVVDVQNGKPASTHIKVIERFQNCCFVEARPRSGYTHQIRAHLLSAGCPIVGDKLYQPREKDIVPSLSNLPIQRQALHALTIEFIHPEKQVTSSYSAPYPDDFSRTMNFFRGQT
jgi:tRNA pseudouridine32 synthase / 23S rRNA pseudouridine746 synthase